MPKVPVRKSPSSEPRRRSWNWATGPASAPVDGGSVGREIAEAEASQTLRERFGADGRECRFALRVVNMADAQNWRTPSDPMEPLAAGRISPMRRPVVDGPVSGCTVSVKVAARQRARSETDQSRDRRDEECRPAKRYRHDQCSSVSLATVPLGTRAGGSPSERAPRVRLSQSPPSYLNDTLTLAR